MVCGCSFAVNQGARQLNASFNTHTPPTQPVSSSSLCGRGLTALVGVEKSLVELQLSIDQASPNATIEMSAHQYVGKSQSCMVHRAPMPPSR